LFERSTQLLLQLFAVRAPCDNLCMDKQNTATEQAKMAAKALKQAQESATRARARAAALAARIKRRAAA
jgi:hypothetical protein